MAMTTVGTPRGNHLVPLVTTSQAQRRSARPNARHAVREQEHQGNQSGYRTLHNGLVLNQLGYFDQRTIIQHYCRQRPMKDRLGVTDDLSRQIRAIRMKHTVFEDRGGLPLGQSRSREQPSS
jgi:hypothetical protein